MFGFGSTTTTTASNYNPNKDYEVPQCPSDGVSCLSWSKAPNSNILACSSWDKSVRIWDVQSALGGAFNAMPKLQYQHEGPVLSCDFTGDTSMLFSAGVDKKVKAYVLATQQSQELGTHDAGVRHVRWCEELKMLITASWDNTLKFWDGKSSGPVASLTLPGRPFAMDLKYPLLVIGLPEPITLAYNLELLRQSTQPIKEVKTNLRMQTRCVSIFTDKKGWASGSIEGRAYIAHLDDKDTHKNFAFKCHRVETTGVNANADCYPVNSISFHPLGTFATAGGDGTFVFWDKDNKQRLQSFKSCGTPISCANFNTQGDTYAYAVSYDWYKGHEGAVPGLPNAVLLHRVQDSEIRMKTPLRR